MSIRNTFQGMSSWSQLLFLCLFSVFGLAAASMLIGIVAIMWGVMNGAPSDIMSLMASANFLRLSQFITTIFLFIIPAHICISLYNGDSIEYLKLDKRPDLRTTLFSVLLIVVAQPVIGFIGYYNEQMILPESMAGLEKWMRNLEDSNKVMMELMMSGNTIGVLVVNIIIVAVMAALAEEIFFRGTMQQIIRKIKNNYHLAVWITAFIFSAIHFQFYGFLPRLLAGALLGYMFVWSGNLWIPIIAHFINNALSVVFYWLYHGTPEYEKFENIGVGDFWWLALIGAVASSFIISFLSKEYSQKQKYAEL